MNVLKMKRLTPILLAIALAFVACGRAEQPPKTESKYPPPPLAYVASRNREPFHHLRCERALKILPENIQQFATREEALAAGKKPCKVCRP